MNEFISNREGIAEAKRRSASDGKRQPAASQDQPLLENDNQQHPSGPAASRKRQPAAF
jgi:hypothetical protein